MTFILSSTFNDSLSRLSTEEQKIAKTTAFDLQVNPSNPGHSFHKLDAVKDKNFWSVRASGDLRIIVHRTEDSLMLCWVDHHDKAYEWASRRKIETHPKTGAAQIVELRTTIQDVVVPRFVDGPAPAKPLLFAAQSKDYLLSLGVPEEWMDEILAATEDSLFDIVDHLPSEAAEALLELATGNRPLPRSAADSARSPFAHPDASRRFRILSSSDELERALASPWDKWIVFLHPDQRKLVDAEYDGPARVAGSAGTGKTIVALHRAVRLAERDPDGRVLLATFSTVLANALRNSLRKMLSSSPLLGERIEVHSMESLGLRLFKTYGLKYSIASDQAVLSALERAKSACGEKAFSLPFLFSEWTEVVDAWDLRTWQEYKDVARLGRKTRLSEAQRLRLWAIFEKVIASFSEAEMVTNSGMFSLLAAKLAERKHPPFEYVVVDEAQDISVPQLKFLAAFGADSPNRLFFCGDSGQRIFRTAFSWKALGIEVRGRSSTLKVNYRTSHQIRESADRLLDRESRDADGNAAPRDSTVSLFNGQKPEIHRFVNREDEIIAAASWLKSITNAGVKAHEIAICVRSIDQITRAHEAAILSEIPFNVLDDDIEIISEKMPICTMNLTKGLEFRAVAVIACDEEIIPNVNRIADVVDPSDLEEVYSTERNLFYVACTRARDFLFISCGGQSSEFINDLEGS